MCNGFIVTQKHILSLNLLPQRCEKKKQDQLLPQAAPMHNVTGETLGFVLYIQLSRFWTNRANGLVTAVTL